jgi:steroid 5-alpha reductase family enzyme
MNYFFGKKQKVKYPFSKLRVYFNGVAGSLALLISISLLLSYSTVEALLFYLLLSFLVTILSLRLKLYLLDRMQKMELDEGYPETEETPSGRFNWRLVAVIALLVFVLILPVISAVLVNPLWWFIGFSGFVCGMSLSEVLLYLSVEH